MVEGCHVRFEHTAFCLLRCTLCVTHVQTVNNAALTVSPQVTTLSSLFDVALLAHTLTHTYARTNVACAAASRVDDGGVAAALRGHGGPACAAHRCGADRARHHCQVNVELARTLCHVCVCALSLGPPQSRHLWQADLFVLLSYWCRWCRNCADWLGEEGHTGNAT